MARAFLLPAILAAAAAAAAGQCRPGAGDAADCLEADAHTSLLQVSVQLREPSAAAPARGGGRPPRGASDKAISAMAVAEGAAAGRPRAPGTRRASWRAKVKDNTISAMAVDVLEQELAQLKTLRAAHDLGIDTGSLADLNLAPADILTGLSAACKKDLEPILATGVCTIKSCTTGTVVLEPSGAAVDDAAGTACLPTSCQDDADLEQYAENTQKAVEALMLKTAPKGSAVAFAVDCAAVGGGQAQYPMATTSKAPTVAAAKPCDGDVFTANATKALADQVTKSAQAEDTSMQAAMEDSISAAVFDVLGDLRKDTIEDFDTIAQKELEKVTAAAS